MIGDITFNGILDGAISGSEGSVVTVTPIQVTGNLIAKISVDGTNYNIYSPIVSGSDISVTPALLSGTLVGTITVDGVDYQLYAPESGDHVTVTNTLLTGTRIATISINGTSKDLFVPPSGDVVNFYPNLESGELIGSISINGVSQQLYAPTPHDVSVTPTLVAGTKIGTITIDNTDYDLYAPNPTDVDVTPVLSSGTKIGTITVNGSNVDLYAPTPVRTASGISYDNTSSGMTADDVQEAVDELKSNLTPIEKRLPTGNKSSVQAIIDTVTQTSNANMSMVTCNAGTCNTLGGGNESGMILCKYFSSDNIINYMVMGNQMALGKINTTNANVTIVKTFN